MGQNFIINLWCRRRKWIDGIKGIVIDGAIAAEDWKDRQEWVAI